MDRNTQPICQRAAPRCALSPAKINLFLELLGKRDDGYHEIDTVMHTVSLADSLSIAPRHDDQICLSVDFSSRLCVTAQQRIELNGPTNLVHRAVSLMQDRLINLPHCEGSPKGLDLQIFKRIPFAAGLGGASANAATTLMLLNQMWGMNLDWNELGEIAAQIGSDVPFFLCGGAVRCTGRGEKIEPMSSAAGLGVVICKPTAGLSTGTVYSQCEPFGKTANILPFLRHWRSKRFSQAMATSTNRLQAAAIKLSKQIEPLLATLRACYPIASMMSGSGSSCFALFSRYKEAIVAAHQVAARAPGCFVFAGRLSEGVGSWKLPRSGLS